MRANPTIKKRRGRRRVSPAWKCHFCGCALELRFSQSYPCCKADDCIKKRSVFVNTRKTKWSACLSGISLTINNKANKSRRDGWTVWAASLQSAFYYRPKPSVCRVEFDTDNWWSCVERLKRNADRKHIQTNETDWGKRFHKMVGTMLNRTKRDQRVAHGKVTKQELFDLLEKQQYKCALTGDELTPENCVADHVKPICKGGEHSINNLQLTTIFANKMKGTMTMQELLDVASKIVNHLNALKKS